MITNETKGQFLHNVIREAIVNAQGELLNKESRNLLLADTNGGKLYKYRAFDENGYSLANLTTQTLHCSKSSSFNDPFDCRIGIDIESMASGIYGWNQSRVENLGEKYSHIINGKIAIEDLRSEDQTVVKRIMNDKELVDFINKIQNTNFSSDLELKQFLFSHVDIVLRLLLTMAENGTYKSQLMACTQSLPEQLNSLPDEVKSALMEYPPENSKLAKAYGINEDTDQISLAVQFSRQLNPTSEKAGEAVEQEINGLIQKLSEELDKSFFVGSLSTNNKNRLMWSHYADSHKGFCIEYDFSKEESLVPLPVFYTKERVKMPWGIAVERTPENEKKAAAEFMRALLTKDDVWTYENEWRLIVNSSCNQDVKMPPISCIYLGALCSGENSEKLKEIAQNMGIPIKRMSIDRGEYSLHVTEL